MADRCDVCEKKTNDLTDMYVLLCKECREKHIDTVLLSRIGFLMEKLEDKEKLAAKDKKSLDKRR